MRRIYRKVFIENKDLSSEDDDLISLCDSDTKQTSGSNDTSLDQTQNFLLDNISETVNVDFEERSNGYEAAQAMEDSSDGMLSLFLISLPIPTFCPQLYVFIPIDIFMN